MTWIARIGIVAACVALGAVGWFTLAPRGSSAAPQTTADNAAPTASAPAVVESPLDLLPVDALLCWKGRPPEDAPGVNEPTAIDALLGLIPKLFPGVLDTGQILGLRLLESFGTVVRYPFAVGLLDARAMPKSPDSHSATLESLKIALVVDCNGDERPFVKIIQRILNELTDEGTGSITQKTAGEYHYGEFYDTRSPQWCRIAWGRIGKQFVVTLGEDVWPRIASVAAGKTTAISRDPWSAPFRGHRATPPLIEVILDAKQLRDRLDPVVNDRATGFFRAWHADDIERGHWALGFEGRAMFCEAYFKTAEKSYQRTFADPSIRDEKYLQTVPGDTRYAIYRMSLRKLLPELLGGIIATRDARDREGIYKWWTDVQAKYGFDAERDVLANMGNTVILHNDPPHPLRIPLAMTALYEIRQNPDKVVETLETMCRAWQQGLDEAAERDGIDNPLRVIHEDDGVWYLEFPFFRGLAWVFTDRYIITSWSPEALRTYLEDVGDKIGTRH